MTLLFRSDNAVDRQVLQLDSGGVPVEQRIGKALAAYPGLALPAPGPAGMTSPATGHDAVVFVDADVWFPCDLLETVRGALDGNQCVIVHSRTESNRPVMFALTASAAAELVGSGDRGLSEAHDLAADIVKRGSMKTAMLVDDRAIRVADMASLARVEARLSEQQVSLLLSAGVRIRDPRSIDIRGELSCGSGVEIDRNVIFEGTVVLDDGVRVGANCIVQNASIGAQSTIRANSIVEGSVIGRGTVIGPYGRVRPGSRVGDGVQLGNFVEVKNSEIGDRSRINHLTFLGDARLGERVTIGAGTITCNHDGVGAARTEIEAGAYIGSGTELVAPVTVGADATIAAGSTITDDVPAGKLTIARCRQVTIQNWKRRAQGPPNP